ncbi:MAG: T9SS type A sorting domain-containing protein, partial [Saprospiraceae bacterium]|nr:T9SS type A sorting domain-containing protein [Saprospiraceae bacterium]
RYKASDLCGNTSYCTFELTVADLVPPSVACDQTTQVALSSDGMALVNASTFDDGTVDNCCMDHFEVRRMNSNNCEDTQFDSTVKFCCSDIGDTILVVFRAWDCHDNYNDCMVSVLVEDKIKPVCLPPAQVVVDCENFDPSLWAYGNAQVTDNCCLDQSKNYLGQAGLTHTVNYSLFDTVCNKGTITRTFRAFDCGNNSSQCTQRVIVTYLQDYFVKFPNDVIVTVCDGTGIYGEPSFFGEDCELLGVSFADDIYTVVPDACFKIERTWDIINWCTFNPNLPLIDVPNPNPNATTNNPANLPGPTVSACGTLPPWAPTVVRINPTDLLTTNFCSFWDANANGYRYKQIIKIIDGQAPTGTYVVPACDNQNWLTPNSDVLWNEPYWWDNGIQTHDLCEEPTELCITGTDACSGSNVNIEFLLFLDLDGDGIMETVINSVNTGIAGLGWNNVLFNNLNTPNFTGGTPRAFDGRPVPTNQKWGFSIQETVTGNNKTACVRWNTQQAQNTFVTPELPHGTHKIKWFITDGCGNNKEYEYTFTVKDCKAPTIVCINGLSVNIMPTAMIQLWASDFLQYTEDNCTPSGQLKIGIRKCGAGTGFPVDGNGNPITNVTFDCTELGTQCVELWAIDAQGNADYCETYVIVQDNLGNCPAPDHINVAGALKTENLDGVEEAIVNIDGTSTFAPPYSYFDLTDGDGLYQLVNNIPLDATFAIAPEKDDNPLNGVTTYDLVLISKHILGIEPLSTPYKMIAADANKSGSITTFDIVEIRKLILGIYTELPNNTSWRFVDNSFLFPNPNNPFQTAFPEIISVANAMSTQWGKDFAGVKIGDVNNTAVANATMQAEERTAGTAIFDVYRSPSPNGEGSGARDVKSGEVFEVTFKSAEHLKGFQFTMLLNGLEAVGVRESDYVTALNFGMVFGNAATVSIDGAQEFTLRFRALKSGTLSEMLGVSGSITRAEAYGNAGRLGIAFRFGGNTISGVGFELYQNQPNPFVNKTFVGFFLPEAAEATLSIFDETGRVVYQQKGQFAKGENSISLDRALINTTGLLFYKLETATDSATKKMIQAK